MLDLSYNNIKEISGLDGLFIQELALRGNQLVSLSGIENLACLTTLDVAHNKITSFEPLSACKQLNYLDASDNDLPRIRELNPLSELEWLRKLIIVHNPCCNKKFYRSRVIYRIPQLIELDSTNVSAEDKIAAMNLYSSQNGDKEMRNHVFEKYFPNEKFIDFSEHISDPED